MNFIVTFLLFWNANEMKCSGIVSNAKMECSDKLDVLIESNGSIPTKIESVTSFRTNLIPRRTCIKRSTRQTPDTSDRKGKQIKIETSHSTESWENEDKQMDPSVANAYAFKHHYCSLCEISFRYSVEYEKHCKQRHGIEKPYTCIQCEKTYATKRSFVQHLRRATAHGEVYPKKDKMVALFCDICKITSRGWLAFEKHALTAHEGIRMMRCSQCSKTFRLRKYLSEHERSRHPLNDARARTFRCEFCKYMFDRTDELEQHRTYCQQRRRQWTIPPKESDALNSSQKNAKCVQLCCDECPEVLESFHLLKDHYEIAHKEVKLHFCDYCDEAFGQRTFLERHLDTRHPDKDRDVVSGSRRRRYNYRGGKIYECRHCGREFRTLVKYERHGKEQPGKGMFRCEKCGKEFGYNRSLRNHANEDHGKGELKKRCEYCTKCYFRRDRFAKHVVYCAAKTGKRAKLRKSGVRGRRCEICNRILYASHLYFRRHINRHKRYDFCHLCDRGFNRIKAPTALIDHIVSRHPLEYEDEKRVEYAKEEIKEEWEMEDFDVKREMKEEEEM